MRGFKTRLLIVLVLIIVLNWINSGASGPVKRMVRPALNYIATREYDVVGWGKALWYGSKDGVPASIQEVWQAPCKINGIARHFGWYYNPNTESQVFNPGMILEIDQDVPVYPVLAGTVTEVTQVENGYQIKLRHGDEIISITRGLTETNLKEGNIVNKNTPLGKASDLLYLEVRNREGPINLEGFFARNTDI